MANSDTIVTMGNALLRSWLRELPDELNEQELVFAWTKLGHVLAFLSMDLNERDDVAARQKKLVRLLKLAPFATSEIVSLLNGLRDLS